MTESRTDDERGEQIHCSCCNVSEKETTEATTETGVVLSDGSALETPLPGNLQAQFGHVLGAESVETLAEWATELEHRIDGGSIDIEDLCHADEETSHVGRMGDETYHFRCFYDAVVLSALADEPVEIRTASPDGAVIEAQAVGTEELAVEPEDAVFSFGIADDVEPPAGDGLTPADIYGAVCPYVKAFPDVAAYERWATGVPAATVAMPLSGATEFAATLVE